MVLGIALKPSDFKITDRKRGCAHAEKSGANFCAQCGKPM
jgi:hypothetical protein